MLNTLLLIGGLALILAGANGLTDGSAAVAKRFRIFVVIKYFPFEYQQIE